MVGNVYKNCGLKTLAYAATLGTVSDSDEHHPSVTGVTVNVGVGHCLKLKSLERDDLLNFIAVQQLGLGVLSWCIR